MRFTFHTIIYFPGHTSQMLTGLQWLLTSIVWGASYFGGPISNHLECQKKHNNTVSYMIALLNSALICSAHFNICGWMKEAECEYSIYCSCSCITGILHSGCGSSGHDNVSITCAVPQ